MLLPSRGFCGLILVPAFIFLSLLIGSSSWIRHSSARLAENNDPPVAVTDSYTVHGSKLLSVMGNDYDPDGDMFTLEGTPTQPQHGSAFQVSPSVINYTAAQAYIGSDSFTYTIRDSSGNTAIGTVNITVVNEAPIAEADSYTVHGQMVIAPIANDHDPESDGVTFQAIVTQPQHGTLTQYNATMFTYQPTYGYVGEDGFTYRIQDGYGAVATGTVHITVVNENPVAEDDSFTIHGQMAISLVTNDHDPESDGVTFQALATQPQHGVLTPVNYTGVFTYRVTTYDYVGTDSFTYTIQDGYGAVATGTVHINVVNVPPIAFPDLYVWKWGLHMTPAENDIDVEGDGVTFDSIQTWPQFGYFTGSSPGTYIYFPSVNLVDFFTHQIRDGYGASAVGLSLILVPDDRWNLGNPGCKGVHKPVDVTTGNMYLRQHDYQSSGLSVARSYNSKSQGIGLFGRGWSSDYDSTITTDNVYVVHLRQDDGRVIYFYRTGTSGAFTPVTPDFHAQVTQGAGGFTLSFEEGSAEQFDANGKLLSLADRNGNTTSLTYATNGFVTSVTDPFGRQLNLTTDTNGQITSIADTTGTIATYTYGGGHELLSVTYADNSAYHFSYDGSYRLLSVTDALSNVVEAHAYDSQGRATTSEVQGGLEHYSLSYVSETETDVTDSLGHVTKYTFDKIKGRTVLTKVEGVCSCGSGGGSQVQTWTYDDKLNLTSKTDALGHARSYTYDANGNPLTVTDASGTVTYTYDARGEILTRKDQLNGVTTNTYDGQGNLLTSKDALNNTTTLTYNSRGQVLTATDARGKTTTLTYDPNGNLSEREDAGNNVTTFSYDARGRITQAEDALSHVTEYAYDAAGRINKITHPDLSFVSFTYDLAGRRTVVTDERGNPTNYAYDGANRLTSITDAASHIDGLRLRFDVEVDQRDRCALTSNKLRLRRFQPPGEDYISSSHHGRYAFVRNDRL